MQKFSKKSSLALTLCILSAISSSGYAAEKSDMITYSLDEVVVTATKTELPAVLKSSLKRIYKTPARSV